MSQLKQLSAEELREIAWRDGAWQPRCRAIVSPYADYCGADQWDHARPGYTPPEFDTVGHQVRLIDHPFVYPAGTPEADRRQLLQHLEALTGIDPVRG
jgi:hypothetical protein